VRADAKLTASVELELEIQAAGG